MTIAQYITSKIEGFGIVQVSEAALLDICEKNSLRAGDEADHYPVRVRELAILRYIPDLLLALDSINEGGFSVSRANSKTKILKYYSFKCKELGVEDLMNNPVVIRNGSNRW